MKVAELGEFGLIERLKRRVAEAMPPREACFPLVLGIGDDAAAWHTSDAVELCTTDTLVEGVHFRHESASWEDLGWKALAVNLSDVAAMGGRPLYATVTLGLPPDTPVEGIDAFYDGLLACAAEYDAQIVGGDLVRSPTTFITVALTGIVHDRPLTRSAARPGETVLVTGPLGASTAGLRLLQGSAHFDEETASALTEAHLRPRPRLAEGQRLRALGLRCAMDVSDGLVADLGKLCYASGLAARVYAERVPVHPAVRWAFPEEWLTLALSGGEEYELLFTAPPEALEGLAGSSPEPGVPIGETMDGPPGRVTVVDARGRDVVVGSGGWDHFHP